MRTTVIVYVQFNASYNRNVKSTKATVSNFLRLCSNDTVSMHTETWEIHGTSGGNIVKLSFDLATIFVKARFTSHSEVSSDIEYRIAIANCRGIQPLTKLPPDVGCPLVNAIKLICIRPSICPEFDARRGLNRLAIMQYGSWRAIAGRSGPVI